jgi:N-methylhydantoinase A
MAPTRIGVDVGGTFTDLVALVDGQLITAKVPSTREQSDGVIESVVAAELDASGVEAFAHGSTVATNSLLERKGARTALVTTEGFRDVIEIGRQNRPSLYDLTKDRPPALVPRDLRFTVTERMGPDGVLTPLDKSSVTGVVEALKAAEVEAIAVCLLFGYLHPEHERRLGEVLREAFPHAHLSLSSEVLPEFREYERFATTVADAYLGPRMASYLRTLTHRAADAGVPPPLVMQSSGGVVPAELAARNAAACVLSGPAAGVLGAAHIARASGFEDVLSFDMGGTSTDVAPIRAGQVATTTEGEIAGVPIRLPMVDVHTVGAGGGSIAWVDEGGALRIGPHSAGADPGPAAYGRGGAEPTVTDADLVLGYLHDGAVLGGAVALRKELAEKTLEGLARQLGMSALEAALGVARVTEAEMGRALRLISVERGLDPRGFALVAFGGAGPMHACALAEDLGVPTVLVPKASGVLSALGLAVSDLRRDYARPLLRELEGTEDAAEGLFVEMEKAATAELPGASLRRAADLRYRGQAFELTVEADVFDRLEKRFHAAHEMRFGYRMDDEPVQLVSVRLTALVDVEAPGLQEPAAPPTSEPERRTMNFDGEWIDAPVMTRAAMGAGSTVRGPAIVELGEATCVVRPSWHGRVDDAGTLVLERQ